MSKLEIPITHPTRLCKVGEEYGYFHMWEQYSQPVPASPLKGSFPAGVASHINAIVEFKDGVRRIDPNRLQFVDEENEALKFYSKED